MDRILALITALRSALFFTGYALLTVFFSLTGIALTWFLPFHVRGKYFVIGNSLIVKWLWVCCGVKTRVIGRLPPRSPYVAISKHQSQWETFYLQWYLFPVATVVKKELFSVPFFGWALRMMNAIAIDRSNPREALRQTLDKGLQRLSSGYSLLIFPEGTRIPHGQKGNYARSGAQIAIKGNAPVLPIAHNAGAVWPGKSFLIKPGTVTLVVGDLIESEGKNSKELMAEVEAWIEARCQEIG